MGTKLNTTDIIKYSAYIVKNNGYVKRTDDPDVECTADKVFDAITKDLIDDDELDTNKEYIIKWGQYIESQTGEYFKNIKETISNPTADEAKIGLIASSFASFEKFKTFDNAITADKHSEYLGDAGDRINVTINDYKLLKSGISKFSNGNSSKWYLYKLHDDKGNVLNYFANSSCEFEFKHCNKISAVISKLSVFNDVKQTTITKVKFLDD